MAKTTLLILENLRSVENTASIFRTGEALGAEKIYCVGTTPTPLDRFGRKRADFAKVSLGAEEMIKWEYQKEIQDLLSELKGEGYKIVSLEQSPKSKKLSNSNNGKFALIVGHETEGVSSEALRESDEILEIPMLGRKESLNVSVATGIALWELLK